MISSDTGNAIENILRVVGQTHEEIYDTVCREKMSEPIFHLFLSPNPNYLPPDDYGLYEPSANVTVKAALLSYCSAANALATDLNMNTFHDRLAAFQNSDLSSDVEQNYYDDFFGWMNPEDFHPDGSVIRD